MPSGSIHATTRTATRAPRYLPTEPCCTPVPHRIPCRTPYTQLALRVSTAVLTWTTFILFFFFSPAARPSGRTFSCLGPAWVCAFRTGYAAALHIRTNAHRRTSKLLRLYRTPGQFFCCWTVAAPSAVRQPGMPGCCAPAVPLWRVTSASHLPASAFRNATPAWNAARHSAQVCWRQRAFGWYGRLHRRSAALRLRARAPPARWSYILGPYRDAFSNDALLQPQHPIRTPRGSAYLTWDVRGVDFWAGRPTASVCRTGVRAYTVLVTRRVGLPAARDLYVPLVSGLYPTVGPPGWAGLQLTGASKTIYSRGPWSLWTFFTRSHSSLSYSALVSSLGSHLLYSSSSLPFACAGGL